MTHTVAVGEFEGPLGILLELVERGRLEVTAISVADITASYLERIKQLGQRPPEELAEFVQLGARLLYIKSLALLPQGSATTQAEELHQLNLELDEYRRLQAAARELAQLSHQRTWGRPVVSERLAPGEQPLPALQLRTLAEAFNRALKRAEPARPSEVIKPHLSLETVQVQIEQRLRTGAFDLQAIIDACRDRLEIIVTFMALLQLVHDGTAVVRQVNQFSPLLVEAAHG